MVVSNSCLNPIVYGSYTKKTAGSIFNCNWAWMNLSYFRCRSNSPANRDGARVRRRLSIDNQEQQGNKNRTSSLLAITSVIWRQLLSILFCRLLDSVENSTNSYPIKKLEDPVQNPVAQEKTAIQNHGKSNGKVLINIQRLPVLDLPKNGHGVKIKGQIETDPIRHNCESCVQCELNQENGRLKNVVNESRGPSSSHSRTNSKPDVVSHGRRKLGADLINGIRRSHSLSQFHLKNNSTPDIIAANSCA